MLTKRFFGAVITVLVVLVAISAPVLATHNPNQLGGFTLALPTSAHWFGTDDVGRDVFSRVLYGSRVSLIIGFGAACVATLMGTPIGLLGGYLGGRTDMLVVQLIDLFIALPGLILALIMTAMVGANIENLILVLGFVMWPTTARLVRGQSLVIRESPFVEAAQAVGGGTTWIVSRHIWPNISRIVAAQFAITASFAIFTSASLSFLGLGVAPPTADWGSMVRQGFQFISVQPALSLAPGAAISLTVLGFYLLGSSVD